MNPDNTHVEESSEKSGFWSLRAVLADLGVGFLVYILIIIILLASRTLPSGFVYVAF